MVTYVPDLGDIVWLNFMPQKDNEISKTRPALVISPKKYNIKTNLAIFLPITSKIKGYPFELPIICKEIKGAILCDQVRSLDWKERKATLIIKLDKKLVDKAILKLQLLLNN